jgi:hypothetical protein
MQYILILLQDNVLQRRTEARLCNHCCAKAISITYSEDMFVALRIQHAMPMCLICHLRSVRL